MVTLGPDDFWQKVRSDLRDAGVTLILGRGRELNLWGQRVHGYFSPPNGLRWGELRVARRCRHFQAVAAHEFGHFEQWCHDTPIWRADRSDRLWKWLSGQCDFPDRQLVAMIESARAIELDAERRAVQFVHDYHLRVDLASYIQEANCGVFYFTWLRRYRKACRHRLSTIPGLPRLMPTHFLDDRDYDQLPDGYEQPIAA